MYLQFRMLHLFIYTRCEHFVSKGATINRGIPPARTPCMNVRNSGATTAIPYAPMHTHTTKRTAAPCR